MILTQENCARYICINVYTHANSYNEIVTVDVFAHGFEDVYTCINSHTFIYILMTNVDMYINISRASL